MCLLKFVLDTFDVDRSFLLGVAQWTPEPVTDSVSDRKRLCTLCLFFTCDFAYPPSDKIITHRDMVFLLCNFFSVWIIITHPLAPLLIPAAVAAAVTPHAALYLSPGSAPLIGHRGFFSDENTKNWTCSNFFLTCKSLGGSVQAQLLMDLLT